MTNHTAGAVRAAIKVIRFLRLLVPSGDINAPKGTMAIQGTTTTLEDIEAIIDRETGLPELQAHVERLEAELERATTLLKEWSQAYKVWAKTTEQTAEPTNPKPEVSQ